MHDYSRDIMLANAQQDMEVTLAKMQLAKKVALTKANTDKAGMLKKQNDELGYMFVPTQVWLALLLIFIYLITSLQASVELIQGKSGTELTQKFDRASMMVVEIYGTTEFCS